MFIHGFDVETDEQREEILNRFYDEIEARPERAFYWWYPSEGLRSSD
jgi:hypothetical protein